MRILLHLILVVFLGVCLCGCRVERGPIMVLFTGDVKGWLGPAG